MKKAPSSTPAPPAPPVQWNPALLVLAFGFIVCLFMAQIEFGRHETVGEVHGVLTADGGVSTKLDTILSTQSQLEVIATEFQAVRGMAWVPNEETAGYLLFADGKERGKVYRHRISQGIVPFDSISVYDSRSSSNGIALEQRSKLLLMCDQATGELARMEKSGDRTALAKVAVEGGAPMDLAVSTNGDVYYTADGSEEGGGSAGSVVRLPRVHAKKKKGGDDEDSEEEPGQYSEAQVVNESIEHPRGLAFSPGGSILYVASQFTTPGGTDSLEWRVVRFDVDAEDGSLSNESVFATPDILKGSVGWSRFTTPAPAPAAILDAASGMPGSIRVDPKGTVYIAVPRSVLVLSAKGELLGRIDTDHPNAGTLTLGEGYLYVGLDDRITRIPVYSL